MGLVIPAMLVRIGLGHTGRPSQFLSRDRAAVWLMALALVARVIAPQLFPAQYLAWLWVAATAWSACFVLVGLRLLPLVMYERIDGKEH